jgi:hypothetical protein
MTDQHTGSRCRPTSYGIEEMLQLRRGGTATALLPDATSPVLLAGSWWAVHETDPTGRYRPVQMPGATEQLDELAGRLAAASAALAALDTEGARFLPEHPEVLE